MANTIVPIAGKRAKSHSRTAVATEAKRIQLQIDADPRLAAAAGGAAHYLGVAAGLEEPLLDQLQSAIVAACREEFRKLSAAHPHLEVTLTRFIDRIEVALVREAEDAPAVSINAVGGSAAQLEGNSSCACRLDGIDRVQLETHDGCAVTRLTKFLHSPASAA
jgi:hypothetical protein